MKRLISICLCFSLLISAIQLPALAGNGISLSSSDNVSVMETVDKTVLRDAPQKSGNKIVTLPENEMVYVVGRVANDSGNTWYIVQYFDKTLFTHAPHLKAHSHNYSIEYEDGTKVCRCGEFDPAGNRQTFALETATATYLMYAAIAVLATVIYGKTHDALSDGISDLVANADDIAEAVGSYAFRQVNGFVMPIRITLSGVAVSVSTTEFENFAKSKRNGDEDIYYPAMLLKNAKSGDSLMIPSWATDMDISEATSYLNSTLHATNGFRNIWELQSQEIKFANIYTIDKTSAEELCKAVVLNSGNIITRYGRGNAKCVIAGESETNADWCKAGSYEHYHLFSDLEKASAHVFFGDMLTGTMNKIIPAA